MAESIEYRPPTQSQNPNMLAVSMPNSETLAAFVETATKCLATDGVTSEGGEQPVAGRVGVGHRLQRGEGLGGDDEQGFLRIEVADGFREVGAVDIGDETEGHGPVAVVLQRLVGHHRPEVGAADADVDDIRMRLPVWPFQVPLRIRSAKSVMLSSTA